MTSYQLPVCGAPVVLGYRLGDTRLGPDWARGARCTLCGPHDMHRVRRPIPGEHYYEWPNSTPTAPQTLRNIDAIRASRQLFADATTAAYQQVITTQAAEIAKARARAEEAALIEAACEVMHCAYEEAAAGAGWETNPASQVPWSDVPEPNKMAMRAAVTALARWLGAGQ